MTSTGTTDSTSSPKAHDVPPCSPQKVATPKRRRISRPGSSLLAQGEPLVWLTGGAMLLCVSMIVGLLGMVIYFGSQTFWPIPAVRVELVDGSVHLGEITRDEKFLLTRQFIETLHGELADSAKKLLGESDQVTARRRLLRTGNFELTNTHFHWVSDHELKPNSEAYPDWALVLERIEWGRFYGEPKGFAFVTTRTPSADERELAALVQLLESNSTRLEDSQRMTLDAGMEAIRKQLETVRTKNTRNFLQSVKAADESRREVVLDGNQQVAPAEVMDDSVVVAVKQVWDSPEQTWRLYQEHHEDARQRFLRRGLLQKHEIGECNRRMDDVRLEVREVELKTKTQVLERLLRMQVLETQIAASEATLHEPRQLHEFAKKRLGAESDVARAVAIILEQLTMEVREQNVEPATELKSLQAELDGMPEAVRAIASKFFEIHRAAESDRNDIQTRIVRLEEENQRYELRLVTASGVESTLRLSDIVLAYPANRLTFGEKLKICTERWREFLLDDPREANSEGGVFPAIFGTVVMTLVMSLAVVPFGVLAALYLREYAKAGPLISAVRISINNLAGVPSIVFGVFGLGFFCYILGAFIDGGPKNIELTPLPEKQWFAWVIGLATMAIGAFVAGLLSLGNPAATGRRKELFRAVSFILWIASTVLLFYLIFWTPFFDGFYAAKLADNNNPTFGKGGLLWSSLTLALLTLPVVIVSTEESLSAVPNSMREGSYACGAGKWQTIRRIVLPQAMPGIMTGMILAMARGAGEVAPLMLVGAAKVAQELPVDNVFPFVHPERSYMHLGFHIYDVAFQSQNSEAAKPMVYTTTLLLILIIATLNIAAVWLRGRLRRRFRAGQF